LCGETLNVDYCPAAAANAAASVRDLAPSLANKRLTWCSTVLGDRYSRLPISALVSPRRNPSRTSRSRAVKSANASSRAGRGGGHPPGGDAGQRPQQRHLAALGVVAKARQRRLGGVAVTAAQLGVDEDGQQRRAAEGVADELVERPPRHRGGEGGFAGGQVHR